MEKQVFRFWLITLLFIISICVNIIQYQKNNKKQKIISSLQKSFHHIQKDCTVILTERIKKISTDGMNLELKQPYEK